jgi:hypothetical protein
MSDGTEKPVADVPSKTTANLTYSKHRLFLFLQFKQAICVLLLFDASSSWFAVPAVGECGVSVFMMQVRGGRHGFSGRGI